MWTMYFDSQRRQTYWYRSDMWTSKGMFEMTAFWLSDECSRLYGFSAFNYVMVF